MSREHIDTLQRVASEEAARLAVRATVGGGSYPLCDADELAAVAIAAGVAAYDGWNGEGAWGALARTVARRQLITHLRQYGPRRRGYTLSLDAPLCYSDDRALADVTSALDALPACDAADVGGSGPVSAQPPSPSAIERVRTTARGAIYRCPATGKTARTHLALGVLRRALERYLAPPYPAAPAVARSLSIPERTLSRVLRQLGLHRTRSQAATLRWQAHHGEPLDPDADPTREAIRLLAHVDRAEDVGRIRRRSLSNVWYHRAASRRRRRAFRLAQPVTELSPRDRQIVHAVARGHTGRDLARRFDLTQARISQITSPFRPCD